MRICGIELKGSEAIICLLDYNQGAFSAVECRQRVFSVSDAQSTEGIRHFQFAFAKLVEDYKIEQVTIVERIQKGKFAGSATSFKLEAAIQLLELPVELITGNQIKEMFKLNPIDITIADLGLKKFQLQAFNAAYAQQNLQIHHQD